MAKTGPKPKYPTPQKLKAAIGKYFEHCLATKRVPTIAGLCYHIGFASRQAFLDQEKRGEEFKTVCSHARLFIEDSLIQRGRPMDMFVLKDNFGYRDIQEVNITDRPLVRRKVYDGTLPEETD